MLLPGYLDTKAQFVSCVRVLCGLWCCCKGLVLIQKKNCGDKKVLVLIACFPSQVGKMKAVIEAGGPPPKLGKGPSDEHGLWGEQEDAAAEGEKKREAAEEQEEEEEEETWWVEGLEWVEVARKDPRSCVATLHGPPGTPYAGFLLEIEVRAPAAAAAAAAAALAPRVEGVKGWVYPYVCLLNFQKMTGPFCAYAHITTPKGNGGR